VLDARGPHVDRESKTVGFGPTAIATFDTVRDDVAKVVGVSDDHDAVRKAAQAARDELGDHVSASRSQPYYCDVTHPDANKGCVVNYLSRYYAVSSQEIATIGDMPNDVLMFSRSGLSIAMGNASSEVQRCARRVTTSNEDEGFANAMEQFVLP
jgi:hydroxymethylpyrimidine pyrophosphatase-like HAD family hydrolase